MPKALRSRPGTTRAAAELGESSSRPKGPVTFLEAQWRKAEAQCRLKDAVREVLEVGRKHHATQDGG